MKDYLIDRMTEMACRNYRDHAKLAYEAYGADRNWKTYDGKPMPVWESLGKEIQGAWIAAVAAAITSSDTSRAAYEMLGEFKVRGYER